MLYQLMMMKKVVVAGVGRSYLHAIVECVVLLFYFTLRIWRILKATTMESDRKANHVKVGYFSSIVPKEVPDNVFLYFQLQTAHRLVWSEADP